MNPNKFFLFKKEVKSNKNIFGMMAVDHPIFSNSFKNEMSLISNLKEYLKDVNDGSTYEKQARKLPVLTGR